MEAEVLSGVDEVFVAGYKIGVPVSVVIVEVNLRGMGHAIIPDADSLQSRVGEHEAGRRH